MSIPNIPISEQFLRQAETWCDLEAAASLLEETKSAVLSQKMQAHGDIPVNRAEMLVKGSDDWKQYLSDIVRARKAANKAKVRLEYFRILHSEWVSQQANDRMVSQL